MTSAGVVRGLAYFVMVATGILIGAEEIRGWIALVLVIIGVAGVFLADRLKRPEKVSAEDPRGRLGS